MGVEKFNPLIETATATIASGAALSDAVDLLGGSLVGVQMPAAWTTASLTFQASADASTYCDVYNAGGVEATLGVVASQFVRTDPDDWLAIRHIKVRSGTAATTVAQAADRVVTLVLRPLGG